MHSRSHRFDHDCPWISNAVGAGNHAYFVGFVVLVTICLASWDYICVRHLVAAAYAALPQRCGPAPPAHHSLRRSSDSAASQAGLAAAFLGNGTGVGGDAFVGGAGHPEAGGVGAARPLPLCASPAPVEAVVWCVMNRPGEVVLLWIYGLYAFFTVCMALVIAPAPAPSPRVFLPRLVKSAHASGAVPLLVPAPAAPLRGALTLGCEVRVLRSYLGNSPANLSNQAWC